MKHSAESLFTVLTVITENKSQFSVGLSSLGQDQFSGRGTLINRLQRMRRKTADQDGPQGEQKQHQQRQPRRQQRENASASTRSAVQDPKERINKKDNKKDGNAVIPSQKRGEGARGVKVAKAQVQDVPKSEYSTIEIGQLPEQELVRKTDLSSLFSAPSPTTHQVVPLNTTTIVRTSTKSSRGQIILERMNGDYSRYLPSNLGATPKETMQTAGPVGYATLALSRVPAVTLRQRQNALAIVSRLAGPITPSRTAKAS